MILILKGLPGSGKTTFAGQWLAEDPLKRRRINYDALRRTFMPEEKFNWDDEQKMKAQAMELARESLTAGHDLIIDNTNLNERHYQKWVQLADEFKTPWEVKFIDTPLHVCVDHDRLREARVGRAVIEGMALRNNMIDWEDYSLYQGRNFVIVDVDGTVANQHARRRHLDVKCLKCGTVNPPRTKKGLCCNDPWTTGPHGVPVLNGNCGGEVTKKNHDAYFAEAGADTPYDDIIRLVRMLSEEFIPIIVSGRPDDKCGKITEDWLLDYGVPFEHLFMRRGGDYQNDDLVKEEILKFLPKERISYVIDDRDRVVQMWRKNGLRVLQVANGDF